MKDSAMLKYFINSSFLSICPEEINTKFKHNMIKHDNRLTKMLNKEQYKEYRKFKSEFERHMFTLRDRECFNMFYLGILLGMEVNNFKHKEKEE